MVAIGCLLPLVLMAGGAVVGGVFGGTTAGLWGAAGGFAIGLILMLAALRMFERARDDLPE